MMSDIFKTAFFNFVEDFFSALGSWFFNYCKDKYKEKQQKRIKQIEEKSNFILILVKMK